MRITVASGVGQGPTPLAAFDAALLAAGVENYNLIPLSSVIPARAVVTRARFGSRSDEYAHRLYVVIARCDVAEVGQHAWAGLGWTQESESGRGLFVELHAHDKRDLEQSIDATLESMKSRRSCEYGKNETELAGTVCNGPPACAVVIACYSSERWRA